MRFGELTLTGMAGGAGASYRGAGAAFRGAGADVDTSTTMQDVAPAAPAQSPPPMMADKIWANWPQWEMQNPGKALMIRLLALTLGVTVQVAIIYFAARAGAKASRR